MGHLSLCSHQSLLKSLITLLSIHTNYMGIFQVRVRSPTWLIWSEYLTVRSPDNGNALWVRQACMQSGGSLNFEYHCGLEFLEHRACR